jgi:hypothetical protein
MYESYKQLEGRGGGGVNPAVRLNQRRKIKKNETRTHIHVPSKIRTYDPNARAVEDSALLRQHLHCDHREHLNQIQPSLFCCRDFAVTFHLYTTEQLPLSYEI